MLPSQRNTLWVKNGCFSISNFLHKWARRYLQGVHCSTLPCFSGHRTTQNLCSVSAGAESAEKMMAVLSACWGTLTDLVFPLGLLQATAKHADSSMSGVLHATQRPLNLSIHCVHHLGREGGEQVFKDYTPHLFSGIQFILLGLAPMK